MSCRVQEKAQEVNNIELSKSGSRVKVGSAFCLKPPIHLLEQSIDFLSNKYNSPSHRAIEFMEAYIPDFSTFEELLFGLNPGYRDHTLHSLWVYLFGHQWIVQMGGYEDIQIAGQVLINYFRPAYPKRVRFVLLV